MFAGLSKIIHLDLAGNQIEEIKSLFCKYFLHKMLIFLSKNDPKTLNNKLLMRNDNLINQYSIVAKCNNSNINISSTQFDNEEISPLGTDWINNDMSRISYSFTEKNSVFITI